MKMSRSAYDNIINYYLQEFYCVKNLGKLLRKRLVIITTNLYFITPIFKLKHQ